MNINLSDELQKISRLWPLKVGLITCLIFETILIGLIFSQVDGFDKTKIFNIPSFVFINFIIWCLTFLCWLYFNKIPKTKKGKFGFIVYIYCDNDETDKKFRADFVNNLKIQIDNSYTGQYFDFIEIKNHDAKSVRSIQDAKLILEKTRGHFIIYGQVKTRNTSHYFELNSIVTHKPIHIIASNNLSKEMAELLPNKIKVEDNNFLEQFEITSKRTEIVSKYLIGNAKLLSGDIDKAFDLYNEILNMLESHINIPVNDQLYKKSKNNLVTVLDIKISSLYQEWVENHNIILFQEINLLIMEYDKYDIKNYSIETIKVILSILLFRDIETAIKILSKFPNNAQNATWLLNHAFLLAYKGDLSAAYRKYKQASIRPDNEFDDGLINKVEDFILLMISQNDSNQQLHYCLGIINKDFKEDFLLAKQDFNNFLSLAPIDSFYKEKEIANKWLSEITKIAA